MCYYIKIGKIYKNTGEIMRRFIQYHLYKFLYILIFMFAVLCCLNFEHKSNLDREKFVHPADMTLTVTVRSIPKHNGEWVSFIGKPKNDIKCFVYVSLNYSKNIDICIGDTLTLSGTVSQFDMPLNEGGNDFSSYAKSQGASVRIKSAIHKISHHKKGMLRSIYSLRKQITQKILLHIPPKEAGLVNALVTGDKDYILEETKDNYRKAGIYHILAISGLHLNLIIMLLTAGFVSSKLKRKLKLIIPFVLTSFACIFLFIFTGFGVSIQRAAFMAIALCLAGIFMREYSPEASLFAICIIILMTEPYSYMDLSFLMSFSATLGVLIGVRLIKKWDISSRKFAYLLESIIISICATMTTLPVTVMNFGAISAVSLFANLVILAVAPVLLAFSYIYALLSLLLPSGFTEVLSYIVLVPAKFSNLTAELFSVIPYSYINVSKPLFMLTYGNLLLLLKLFRINKKYLRFVLIVIITIANIITISYNVNNSYTKVSFLNCGQGDCSVISGSDGSVVMIDCGSETYSSFGKNEVIPYLIAHDIQKIDALFITHYHSDHSNGAVDLIDEGYVKRLILPERSLARDEDELAKQIHHSAVRADIPIEYVSEGQKLKIGKDHMFKILNPSRDLITSANDGSMIINYKYGKSSVLYMGDAEEKAQYRISENLTDCDILKIAHHGDKCTMSENTAKLTDAEYAVISCAKDNIYGHPADETLMAYKKSRILRTYSDNTSFIITKNKVIYR